ncbi:hypothetical protein JCGZ_16695 [Jatropha curcas]|uniref:Uncharacterized protein n=1 Tax=Jatropha curcas TaxID=180498 RepID=A0A067K307_JATCU|nr:hypothetical protein JCGZ_16695 [Jatropha curcas]
MQYNQRAATLSYLYYGMDLYLRGTHLKVSYRHVIEIWDFEHRVLPMPMLFGFDTTTNEITLPRGRPCRFSRRYAHTTSDILAFWKMLNGLAWDRLLVHVPPSTEFDLFAKVEELDRDQGIAPARAPNMAIIVGKPEHGPGASFSFISERTRWTTQGMLETHLVSIANYNEVCQLYEAMRLKLAVMRLSNKHISISIKRTK